MRVIQKQAGQILLSIFLAGSCFAADLRAADTLSIATQIASPTDTLRQTYDHWSFIRPSLQSPVCITSNIDSRPLPRLVFGDESAPRSGADEAAITLSVGKWDSTQTYSSFLKLFMAQPPQDKTLPVNPSYRFKSDDSAVLSFPNGTDIHFENYDQYYNVVNPDSLNLLLESLQNQTVAELSGTLINHNNSLIEQKDTFRVMIKLDGFKTAYQQMLTDCQSL